MKHFSSRENPHFKALKRLCQSGRERRKTGLIVLDGMHLIESFVEHFGAPLETVVSERGATLAENARFLESGNAGATISVLTEALFGDIVTVETSSGIMAIAKQPKCRRGLDQQIDTVVLDGVQDPGNVGSIFRSAAAAGFRQILLSADCAQAWSPKTLRAAMGAHFQLDIHENSDLPGFLGGYRGQVVMTTLEVAPSLYSLCLDTPLAWVFGSEGQGVRREVSEVISTRAHIPMPGRTNSLNVAAAAAICLFETARQRIKT